MDGRTLWRPGRQQERTRPPLISLPSPHPSSSDQVNVIEAPWYHKMDQDFRKGLKVGFDVRIVTVRFLFSGDDTFLSSSLYLSRRRLD